MFYTWDESGERPFTIEELTRWVSVAKQRWEHAKKIGDPEAEYMEQRLDEGLLALRALVDANT